MPLNVVFQIKMSTQVFIIRVERRLTCKDKLIVKKAILEHIETLIKHLTVPITIKVRNAARSDNFPTFVLKSAENCTRIRHAQGQI